MSKSISKHSNRKKVKFPYTIIIPSDQQPDTLHTHTLTLLKTYRIPKESIVIAVPDADQETVYKTALPSELYGVIVPIHAPYASAEFYNSISDRFPEGIPLVYMADNIQGFYEKEPHITTPLAPIKSLWALFKQGFQECEKAHSQLWGIYPIANGHFMSRTVSTQLKYLPGCLWGCFNPGSAAIHLTLPSVTDYERSILFWKTFGSVVRLNWVACHVAPGSTIQAIRPAKKLAKLYPGIVRLESTSSGNIHIRLDSEV
jgi:hypothetical protein